MDFALLDALSFNAMIAGFCFSLLIFCSGVGAGVLVVPALIVLFEMEPTLAVATGSTYAFLSKILMTIGHSKQGGVDWSVGGKFLFICLPFTIVSAFALTQMNASSIKQQVELSLLIIVLAAGIISVASMLTPKIQNFLKRLHLSILSSITGVLMGLTGVGGGVLVVPALTSSGGLSAKASVATSIPIGLILSLAVSLTLGSQGYLDYPMIASLMVGTVVAMPVAAKLFKALSDRAIRYITIVFITLALIGLANTIVQTS